jgi:hypothetical protein
MIALIYNIRDAAILEVWIKLFTWTANVLPPLRTCPHENSLNAAAPARIAIYSGRRWQLWERYFMSLKTLRQIIADLDEAEKLAMAEELEKLAREIRTGTCAAGPSLLNNLPPPPPATPAWRPIWN